MKHNPYNPNDPDFDPAAATGLFMAKYLGKISAAEYEAHLKGEEHEFFLRRDNGNRNRRAGDLASAAKAGGLSTLSLVTTK